jgi:hypothetical protein
MQLRLMNGFSFTDVFFIDSSSAETIDLDLRNIAIVKEIGQKASDALAWLSGQCQEWLLLFDSADDTTVDLHDVLPSCSHGNILITTRNYELRAHAPHANYKVSNMVPEDATNLLFTMICQEISDEAQILVASIVKVES